MLTRLLWLLMLLAPGLAQAGAQVAGYDVEIAVYKDLGRELTIDTAPTVSFNPTSGRFGLGFDPPVTWLRMTLRPIDRASMLARPLVLRVGPYQLDQLDFYQQVEGRWVVTQVGDLRPQHKTSCFDDLYCFALHPRTQGETIVYLRIKTTGFPFVLAEFIPTEELNSEVNKRTAFLTASLTSGFALLLIGLMLLTLERTATLQAYCAHQLIIISLLVLTTGKFSFAESSLQFVDWATAILIVCRNASLSLVFWLVLAPYRPAPVHRRLVFGLFTVYGVAALLLLAGQIHLAFQFSFILQIVAPFLVIQGVMVTVLPRALRNTLFIGCGLYAVLLATGYRIVLGYGEIVQVEFGMLDWRLNGAPIGLFVIWIMLSEHRRQNMTQADEYLKIEVAHTQLRADARTHSERGAMIEMLTHELKTPLSTIRFALASASRLFQKQGTAPENDGQNFMRRIDHIESSVNRMDSMIEQVAQSHKVEHMVMSVVPETMVIQALIEDLVRPYASTHHFELDIEAGLLLRSDRLMLTALVENLISNACKYSVDQRVSLSVTAAPAKAADCKTGVALGAVRLAVANRVAVGCEPDEQRLFERYYRHPAVSDRPGTGMGLHVARAVAAKIGATLRYRFDDGVAIFEASFPC